MQDLVGLARLVALLDLLVGVRLPAVGGPAGSASCWRCSAQATAKPVLRIPPGYSVVAVASIVDSGEIASRSGGSSCAVNSWLIAP